MAVTGPAKRCGALTKRCKADPPTCAHADGVHGCRLGKGAGTNHKRTGKCRYHAGATATGRRHASGEAAQLAIAKLGLPLGNGDPFVLLEDATRYVSSMLHGSGRLLVDVVDGKRPDITFDIAFRLHLDAIRQGATTGHQAITANVADRQAKISKQLANVVVAAIQAGLDAAGVTGEKRALAEAAAADVLEVKVPVGAELN